MVAVEVADRLQDVTVGIAEALPLRRRVLGEDRHLVARIGAFTDFMAAALTEGRDLIEGRRPL